MILVAWNIKYGYGCGQTVHLVDTWSHVNTSHTNYIKSSTLLNSWELFFLHSRKSHHWLKSLCEPVMWTLESAELHQIKHTAQFLKIFLFLYSRKSHHWLKSLSEPVMWTLELAELSFESLNVGLCLYSSECQNITNLST